MVIGFLMLLKNLFRPTLDWLALSIGVGITAGDQKVGITNKNMGDGMHQEDTKVEDLMETSVNAHL